MRSSLSSTVLAIDIGTSSSRAALHDARGRRLLATTAQFAYPLQTGPDGRAELQPGVVGKAVFRAVKQSLAAASGAAPVAAIGVSCFWHSMLGLDGEGKVITPIYTWADSRCREEAAALRRPAGEIPLHRRTGCMARTSFWPARLLWLRRADRLLFARVARWVSPAEWLQEQCCGRATVSRSMASGTGLLNAQTLQWDRPLLKRCGLSASQLNPLSDEPLPVSAKMARQFPRLAAAKWFPGIGDGAASNLGSGATIPGVAAINVGTSAALRIVVDEGAKAGPKARALPAPFGLFGYRVDARRRLVGGAVSNAGNLRAWALRELKFADPKAVEKALAGRPLPVAGLTILPFWMAERAPTWPEDLASVVLGITQATTALDLLQTLQEATYHRLAAIADRVEKVTRRRLTVVVSGGINHSADSLQRLADVLGRPVRASKEPEASLRGAALFALERLGHTPARPLAGALIRPRPAPARAHAIVRRRQERLEKFSEQWTHLLHA